MKITTLKNVKNLKNKVVFLRVDFNVALNKGKVAEDYRLVAGLETINFLLERGARVVVATHLGDPKGKIVKELSVKPVALRLKALLKKPVKFIPEVVGEKVNKAISILKAGELMMLENLRFHPGELTNDKKFAKELVAQADIYVNDAFAVCHREQASVVAVKSFLPAYAGLLLEKEVIALNKVLKPTKPLVVIMGGAKISTKAPLITKLYKTASQILLGGALANNFFKYQKLEIGKSLFDADSLAEVKKFYQGKKLASKIILPLDVVVKTRKGTAAVRYLNEVKSGESILDIGPETIALYSKYIKAAHTLVWNGPMGKFEEASFKHGTLAIALLVASRASGKAFGLVGGGETVEALRLTKMEQYVDWVSTAGGAMLTYLSGGKMPGLVKIVSK
ncbi:phosphoglycerate kinase [Candidatus Falkowbacteria bacterium]|jgi:phosphoglycerate kinase|nr:phosphoglycerate kinase [Candidatus Falkowbacteria bacterium]